jgi:transposase-like protein
MEDAVIAMLTQRNVEEAARSAGISTATLMRWIRCEAEGVRFNLVRRLRRNIMREDAI